MTVNSYQSKYWSIGIWASTCLLILGWLLLPASNAIISITANSGAASLDVLCGERLTWDLPLGRTQPRSNASNWDTSQPFEVLLELSAGANVELISKGPHDLYLRVGRSQIPSLGCATVEEPPFRIQDKKNLVIFPADPIGYEYRILPPEQRDASNQIYLPFSGRLLIGRPVQHGAGWRTASTEILHSGSVTSRVVPLFSNTRIDIKSQTLDEGSLLDTHACLDAAADNQSSCPTLDAIPAHGFLRTSSSDGALTFQLYAIGPVGIQAYGSTTQSEISVKNITTAWRSEALIAFLTISGAFLAVFRPLAALGRFGFASLLRIKTTRKRGKSRFALKPIHARADRATVTAENPTASNVEKRED